MERGRTVRRVIESQPEAWAQVLASDQWREWSFKGRVLLAGSGTSYYLALAAAAIGRKLGMDVSAVPTQDIILDGSDLIGWYDSVVVISRSGETSEALWSIEVARKQGKAVLGVTCNPKAPLVNRADQAWVLPYAHDHTVVMVSSFSSMLLAFEKAFAATVSRASELNALVSAAPDFVKRAHDAIYQVTRALPRRLYILGAGIRYGIALEGALKSLEMSNQTVATYGPLEFRHGPWGSLTEDDLVVILGQPQYNVHERQVLYDLAQRTQRLLTVAQPRWFGTESLPGEAIHLPDDVDDLWCGPLAVIPLQWFGFYWALGAGRDPDAPKNLTPVVDLSYGAR